LLGQLFGLGAKVELALEGLEGGEDVEDAGAVARPARGGAPRGR